MSVYSPQMRYELLLVDHQLEQSLIGVNIRIFDTLVKSGYQRNPDSGRT